MTDNRFLLINSSSGNLFYLLQQGNAKSRIIIGQGEGSGPSGGVVKQTVGKSLAKQQLGDRPTITAKATSLGTLLLTNLYNKTKSKLVIPITLSTESKITYPALDSISVSKIKLNPKNESTAAIIQKDTCTVRGKLNVESFLKNSATIRLANPLKEKMLNVEKTLKRMQLLKIKAAVEALRNTPLIQVTVNTDITQRGNMLRITTNMDKPSPQIWMRIIDSNAMIVQKAGLVKKNASGFQILIGTKDLKAGKYTIQVSNHINFSPLGVSEFEVKGVSPIVGIIPLIPLIPLLQKSPDSPDQTFEKVIFRTMQDRRVDEQCKEFENRVFDINDKNLPVPPIHFNCRCHLEGKE